MIVDWNAEILEKVALKKRLMHDYALIEHHFPARPAAQSQVEQVENQLGFSLDSQFRNFLLFADGWKGFVHTCTLFGTNDLLRNTDLMEYASRLVAAYNPDGYFPEEGLKNSELLIIGVSKSDLDIVLLGKPSSPKPGYILRIVGSGVAEFPTFHSFFRATLTDDQFFIELGNEAGS